MWQRRINPDSDNALFRAWAPYDKEISSFDGFYELLRDFFEAPSVATNTFQKGEIVIKQETITELALISYLKFILSIFIDLYFT